MLKILAVIGFLFAVLVGVVLSDDPSPDADLTIIQIQDNFTLDPQRMSYNHDLRMSYAIYEGLARWDNEDPEFTPQPAGATHWDISPDGLTYTFHLRPEARWSNGDPVTAHNYIYAWQRALLPEFVAEYSGMFFRIRGAEDYFNWRAQQTADYAALTPTQKIARFNLEHAADDAGRPLTHDQQLRRAAQLLREESNRRFAETVGLRALDDLTLEVTLARPTGYFLDLMAFGPFYPVHPPTLEKFLDINTTTGVLEQRPQWTKPANITVNGPYTITQWRFKRDMLLEPNPHYWNPSIVRSKTVKMIAIEDANTGVLAFNSGAADWHSDITVDYLDQMIAKKRADHDDTRHPHDAVQVLSTFGTYFWWFNCEPTFSSGEPNPFHDPRVRRAFALAVDKQSIVQNVKKTGEHVSDILIPRDSVGNFTNPKGLAFDPVRARRELAEAGWADRDGDGALENTEGRTFPIVELLCSTASYHQNVALAMGRMWEETLGVKTTIASRESKIYKDNLQRQDYMMARGGWFGDYGDPTTFLDFHKTGDGQNNSGFSDPYFDGLMAQADGEPDPDKRLRILEEAERYTMDEMLPILPLWQYNYYYLFWDPQDSAGNPVPGGLKGISFHPRLVQYIWKLEVVK